MDESQIRGTEMYLDEAKQILNNEYKTKYPLAHAEYAKAFMNEKIKHSYQVLGAGNFILKHEDYFTQYNSEEISYYQAIVLLHDIYRFQEILEIEKGHKVDHGVCGAEYLSEINFFNKQDALLAIKHHGHLIERLYDDETYQKLSHEEKEHIKQISFLVRDADKLANFYLLATHYNEIGSLFFVEKNYANPHDKNISSKVIADFQAHKCVNKTDVKNFADHALIFLSWLYDINFKSSFIFLEKLHILEKIFVLFKEFLKEEDMPKIQQTIQEFIKARMAV